MLEPSQNDTRTVRERVRMVGGTAASFQLPEGQCRGRLSVTEHGRDSLVEVEDAGFVEKDLAASGQDILDHFVDSVVQRIRSATAVREQTISLRVNVGRILEVGLDEERLAALLVGGSPDLINSRRVPIDFHRLIKSHEGARPLQRCACLEDGPNELAKLTWARFVMATGHQADDRVRILRNLLVERKVTINSHDD